MRCRQLLIHTVIHAINNLDPPNILLCAGQIVLPQFPPGQPRGQRKNVCDKKGRGTLKKGEISDYIGRDKEKIK